MDDEEIARLCKSLNLSEDEVRICNIEGKVLEEGVAEVKHCLVGKVLAARRVNCEGFRTIIEQIWGMYGEVKVESIGNNIFMFYFSKMEVRDLIWNRGPWHFENNLIVLEKPEGVGDVSKLAFDRIPIWVQIHKLPLMCMTPLVARVLAGQIGDIVWTLEKSRDCRGKFLRVKVSIDISRQLKRVLRLSLGEEKEPKMVVLSYENLPEFCYTCGRLGHRGNECRDEAAMEAVHLNNKREFGSWLRASQNAWGRRKLERSASVGERRERQKKKGVGVNEEAREEDGVMVLGGNPKAKDGGDPAPARQGSEESLRATLKGGEEAHERSNVELAPPSITKEIDSGEYNGILVVAPREEALVVNKGVTGRDPLVRMGTASLTPGSAGASSEANLAEESHEVSIRESQQGSPCTILQRKWKRDAREGIA